MLENLVPSSLSNKCPYYLNLLIKGLLLISKLTLISFSVFKRLFFSYEKNSMGHFSFCQFKETMYYFNLYFKLIESVTSKGRLS